MGGLTWGSWGLVLNICPQLSLESRRGPDVSLQSGPLRSVVATTLYYTTKLVVWYNVVATTRRKSQDNHIECGCLEIRDAEVTVFKLG